MSEIEYNTFQQNIEKTFAPMTDALKNVTTKFEVPDAAREFVKRSAELAKDRATDVHTGAAKATDAMETAASKAVSGMARLSRDLQTAALDDATALFDSVVKVANAKTLSEAAELQVSYLRERGEVNVGRARSFMDFLTGSFAEGAKKAQENIAKVTSFNKAA